MKRKIPNAFIFQSVSLDTIIPAETVHVYICMSSCLEGILGLQLFLYMALASPLPVLLYHQRSLFSCLSSHPPTLQLFCELTWKTSLSLTTGARRGSGMLVLSTEINFALVNVRCFYVKIFLMKTSDKLWIKTTKNTN